jgi:UDPglucose 6-dehydrogenase
LREVYKPLMDGSYYQRTGAIPQPDRASIPPSMIVTSRKSGELIKHASNAFLAMKISFINAVSSVCESVGGNVNQVVHGIGTDSRIGRRFLNPGVGYGGSCFPNDVMAFRAVAREAGYDFRLLDEVMRINEEQRQHFLRKVRSALLTLRGKNLGVLGLAFKGGTDDIRELPALFLVQALLQEGGRVTAYDPAAMERPGSGPFRSHLCQHCLRSGPRRLSPRQSSRRAPEERQEGMNSTRAVVPPVATDFWDPSLWILFLADNVSFYI